MVQTQSVNLSRMNDDARRAYRASLRRVACPRTKLPITEKGCAECRKAAHLVPVLAEACGQCPRNREA